jgi:phosphoribosylanthranilate isomerase
VTKVKICGITRPEDAELAVSLGAWALGFILWPQSKRAADPAVAAGIARALRRRPVELVGVFVNQPLDDIARYADALGLTYVQLHGDEGPAFCTAVAERTGARVIKALGIGSGADIRDAERFHTDFHLLDAYSPRSPGGTGESFDWELARKHSGAPPVVLSGGLNPGNVGEAIEQARPFAVDVASGTEAAPGRKDPAKLEAFFRAVEAADARLGAPA